MLEEVITEEFSSAVEANLDRDPLRIALDPHVLLSQKVATQVKYLHRARTKLPSWFASRCLFFPLSFEQSSSELSALARSARLRSAGPTKPLAIDLTCGLGVDSWALAKNFKQVIAIERDPDLAAVAQENFRRLDTHNIQVINTSAEDFLSSCKVRADLVFADPDRRATDGRKLVRLQDCSPDILSLLPKIQNITSRLVVKLSPLFDVDELFRIFRPFCTHVQVISLDGECKEIVADVDFSHDPSQTISAVALNLGETTYSFSDNLRELNCNDLDPKAALDSFSWLIIPDVALQKARLARRYFSERGIFITSDNAYGFSPEKPQNIIGKALEIQSIEHFNPKELKRRLKAEKIKSIDILRHDFPLSASEIARQLGVSQGGQTRIAFTKFAGQLLQISLKN